MSCFAQRAAVAWSVLPRAEKVPLRKESYYFVLKHRIKDDVRKNTEATGKQHQGMLGLDKEVFVYLWHQQKKTGTAQDPFFHWACCMSPNPLGPKTTPKHLIRFYFQKGVIHSSLSNRLYNQAVFLKTLIRKSHFHLQKSGYTVKHNQDYKNTNVIKFPRPWE